MALFKPTVLKKILDNEGFYSNDPDDRGGETWAGVARNINPSWAGWAIVDRVKANNPNISVQALNHLLNADINLAQLVSNLYQSEYWNVNNLGALIDQQLAGNVCDCGVNCGTFTGAKMLQDAYNIAHAPGALPLVADGKIGAKTIAAVNSSQASFIYAAYNQLRKAYYDRIISERPVMAKFRSSWYSRIIPYVS